jgi:hypothetical protein
LENMIRTQDVKGGNLLTSKVNISAIGLVSYKNMNFFQPIFVP